MLGDELVDRVRVINHDAPRLGSLHLVRHARRGVPVWLNRPGSRPTCGSPPASSSRTSSPASAVARSWSRPGWPVSRPCSPCTTPARIGSDPRRPGRCARAIRCTTTSARSPRRPVSTSPSTSCSTRDQQIVGAFGGEILRHARGGARAVRATAMRAGARAVRRRRHHQRGFPARPEPLPGGQGHVGRGVGGAAGRADHRARPSAGTASPTTAASGPSSRRRLRRRAARGHRRRERTVPDQWQVQVLARVLGRARVALYADGLTADQIVAAHLLPVDDLGAALDDECARIARQRAESRGSASCRKARRRSRTSRALTQPV